MIIHFDDTVILVDRSHHQQREWIVKENQDGIFYSILFLPGNAISLKPNAKVERSKAGNILDLILLKLSVIKLELLTFSVFESICMYIRCRWALNPIWFRLYDVDVTYDVANWFSMQLSTQIVINNIFIMLILATLSVEVSINCEGNDGTCDCRRDSTFKALGCNNDVVAVAILIPMK